jgi:hypothetical protein
LQIFQIPRQSGAAIRIDWNSCFVSDLKDVDFLHCEFLRASEAVRVNVVTPANATIGTTAASRVITNNNVRFSEHCLPSGTGKDCLLFFFALKANCRAETLCEFFCVKTKLCRRLSPFKSVRDYHVISTKPTTAFSSVSRISDRAVACPSRLPCDRRVHPITPNSAASGGKLATTREHSGTACATGRGAAVRGLANAAAD